MSEEANAAALLRAASSGVGLTPVQFTQSTDLLNDNATAATLPPLRALVGAQTRTFDLLREARRLGAVDWSASHPTYLGNPLGAGGSFNWQTPALLLYDAAWLSHAEGDDAAAIESLRDLLFLEQALADYPVVNSHVWAAFVAQMVCKRVEDSLSTLRLGANAPGAATPAQVRALIGDLLDETSLRRAYLMQMRWEKGYWLDQTRRLSNAHPLYRPVLRRDAVRIVEIYGSVIAAVQQPDWPAARAALGSYPRHPLPRGVLAGDYPIERFARPLSATFTETYGAPAKDRRMMAEHLFFFVAMKRMAAVALATTLYRADHHGTLPPSLDSLVPQYLPEVPRDPYAPGGPPIGYFPAALPPRLYCVALDGHPDDPGNATWTPFFARYEEDNILFHLAPPPPPTPATSPNSSQSGSTPNRSARE